MKIKCKKDYYHNDILVFKEDMLYPMLSETEYTVMIVSSIGRMQFRKIEETKIGVNNFERLSLFTEYFYTKCEMRQMKIEKLLND